MRGGIVKYLYSARLANCGILRHRYNFSTLRDANILQLVVRLLLQLCSAFVPENKRALFLYDLACYLLKQMGGSIYFPGIEADVVKITEHMRGWRYTYKQRGSARVNAKPQFVVEELSTKLKDLSNANHRQKNIATHSPRRAQRNKAVRAV